jgi:hypothetical protein
MLLYGHVFNHHLRKKGLRGFYRFFLFEILIFILILFLHILLIIQFIYIERAGYIDLFYIVCVVYNRSYSGQCLIYKTISCWKNSLSKI